MPKTTDRKFFHINQRLNEKKSFSVYFFTLHMKNKTKNQWEKDGKILNIETTKKERTYGPKKIFDETFTTLSLISQEIFSTKKKKKILSREDLMASYAEIYFRDERRQPNNQTHTLTHAHRYKLLNEMVATLLKGAKCFKMIRGKESAEKTELEKDNKSKKSS